MRIRRDVARAHFWQKHAEISAANAENRHDTALRDDILERSRAGARRLH
jgi:hypothetical protein